MGAPMEEQEAWRPHADFMNALVDDGFIVLGRTARGAGRAG